MQEHFNQSNIITFFRNICKSCIFRFSLKYYTLCVRKHLLLLFKKRWFFFQMGLLDEDIAFQSNIPVPLDITVAVVYSVFGE